MAYGLKYTTTFDSFQGQPYILNISQKDYTGDSQTTLLAGVGVTLRTNTDEMKAPIKGHELVITKVNLGNLPITEFLSEEDDTFLVEFFWGAQNLFTGFLLQDDLSEEMVSWNHPITLKATDALGLLKNITLQDAAITFGDSYIVNEDFEQTGDNSILIQGSTGIQAGMILIINSGTALDGQYSVLTWTFNLLLLETEIFFTQDLNGTVVGPINGDITYITPIDLTQRMFLSDILALCLKSTGVRLPIAVYSILFPVDAPDERIFDNILIDPTTFEQSEDRWKDCYQVIEDILGRFYFSLFQAEGYWNIIRWDELRITFRAIPGNLYDEDFVFTGTTTLENDFIAGIGQLTVAETGLTYIPVRAFKFTNEIFKYRNPTLIKNINFTQVGRRVSVTTDGTDTITDYEMIGWEQGFEWTTGGNGYIGSANQRLIRVRIDAAGNEIDRFSVMKGNTGFDDYAAAQSNGVEVVAGDIIRYSFDTRTSVSQPGVVNNYFRVNLLTTANPTPRSANNRYLASNGKWYTNGPFIIHTTPTGGNTNEWHTVSVESDPVPFTGLVIVKLAQSVPGNSSTKETHYKNIRFEVVRNIAGSKKIESHQHRDQQLPIIKNNSDKEIMIDNSPSNALAGTLFYDTFTGPVRDRVGPWNYNGLINTMLGSVTTVNELFLHRTTRIKMEGNFKGLIQGEKHLSLLSTIIYTFFNNKRFNFGILELIFRNGMANFTLYENYVDLEEDADLKQWYTYKYLFEK